MSDSMILTNADYLAYKQCPKSLWIRKHQKEVLPETFGKTSLSGSTKEELLRNLFPSGKWMVSTDIKKKAEETAAAIESGETVLLKAAFAYEDKVAIVDAAVKHNDGWHLFNVTTSTHVKERHIDECTYASAVAQEVIPVYSLLVVAINSDYVRGQSLSFRDLVTVHDVTEQIAEKQRLFIRDAEDINDVVLASSYECSIGTHCSSYGKEKAECPAKQHCWADIPSYSVFNVARIGSKAYDLYQDGVVNFEDIPDEVKLTANQRAQVDMYKNKTVHIDTKSIQEFLSDFTYPLYFLDFETYQSVIPLYEHTSPYQQLPFQYSLHIQSTPDHSAQHKEFLAKEGTDARRLLAERLIHDIPRDVNVVAYNMSFEKRVLRELADLFPDLATHLLSIHDNMLDIMVPFQKKWYQSYRMKGKYSIKYVLPALFPDDPELNYQTLDIQNGSMAMDVFAQLHTYPPERIKELREALLAYCKLDTYAMVKIFKKLQSL